MKTIASPSVARASTPTNREESVRHLPDGAQEALRRFQADGDSAALDQVLLAILADYIPSTPVRPLAELPGSTRLIDDLGFDSLAITEVVFFAEDLFGISITNQEIMRVRTLDDLNGFIHRKVAIHPAR